MLKKIAKKTLFNYLSKLHSGTILLIDETNQTHHFGNTGQVIELKIHTDNFYPMVILGGTLAAAKAYIQAVWDCGDLTAFLQLMLANYRSIKFIDILSSLRTYLSMPFHLWQRNTLNRSKDNISAHYDLNNDFFSLFLDSRMMYSSAWYSDTEQDLETASANKLARICQMLALNDQDHLLEIGSGWGGFAEFASQHFSPKITTTTISKEQYKYVQAKIKTKQLDGIELLQKDYRQLQGQFDKIVSIEMLEAVGHHYFKQFFKKCDGLLKADGKMLIQTILINDQNYRRAKYEQDFIKKYIFPGGCLPSLSVIMQIVAKKTHLRLIDLKDIGLSYAKTLAAWRERFEARLSQVRQLGFDEPFTRCWRFYLCYCEAGFRAKYITDVQLLFDKPKILV